MNRHWLYPSLISVVWFLQASYLFLTHPPTYFFASDDFLALSQHLVDTDLWGEALYRGTSQLRGIGYPATLALVTLGTLSLELLEIFNFASVLIASLAFYFLLALISGRSLAFLATAIFLASGIPWAFSVTLLSEHLIIVLLMIAAPLSIISITSNDLKWRVGAIAAWLYLTLIKVLFAPGLLLLLVIWLLSDLGFDKRLQWRRTTKLAASAIVGIWITASATAVFVSNSSSGAFIFGLMNPIGYGAYLGDELRSDIYDPLFEKDILDSKRARGIWNVIVKKANLGADKENLLEISDDQLKHEIFSKATLETYWQLKWTILRATAPDRAAADALSRQLYLNFIRHHPGVFSKLTLSALARFVAGKPAHFRYDFIDDQRLYRNENGFRLHGTNKASNDRLLEGFRTGLGMDINQKRNPKALMKINATSIIRYTAGALFFVNLMIQAIWILLVLSSIALNRVKRLRSSPVLGRINLSVFFLNAAFVGLGLGTVLFHPPIGRYILMLAPLVFVASLSAAVSCYLMIKEAYKNTSRLDKKDLQ